MQLSAIPQSQEHRASLDGAGPVMIDGAAVHGAHHNTLLAQADRINNMVERAIQLGRSETRPWIYVGTALGFLAGVSLSIMISRLPAIADAIAAGGAW